MAGVESWRLYWSPASSAALRVVLALRAKGLRPTLVECVPNEPRSRASGTLVYEVPRLAGSPGTNETVDYTAISPEGRIPALAITPPGSPPVLLTQAAAILEAKLPAIPLASVRPVRARLPQPPPTPADSRCVASIQFLEEAPTFAFAAPRLLPASPWARARVRQICWIIGADTHPLQNMGTRRSVGGVVIRTIRCIMAQGHRVALFAALR